MLTTGIDFKTINHHGNNIHILHTSKFKTTTIQVHVSLPLQEEHVTKAALIANVLKRGNVQYPTELKLRERLDDLYGASFDVDVLKKGENQVVVFQMEIAQDAYLPKGSSLLQEAIELLSAIILQPVVVEEGFTPAFVQIEKENLVKRINSIIDDKIRFANLRATQEMCMGEPYALSALGIKEEIDGITPQDLYRFYREIFLRQSKDIYVVGEAESTRVKGLFLDFLEQAKFEGTISYAAPIDKSVHEPRTVIEELEVTQGKLHLGFRTHTILKDDDYVPMLVFNGLFGAYPHSKLFINVREKASLAYYAVSRLESLKGIMMVMSGIEFANYEKAKGIILEQLDQVRSGAIRDEELTQTKAVLINQLREIQDSAYAMIDYHYNSTIGERYRSLEEVIAEIQSMQVKNITKAAAKVELDLVYFLRNKGGNTE